VRIVFCGTPQFAVHAFKHILAEPDLQIVGVITQPDRPSGRGMKLSFSPVKEATLAAGLPVHQPEKIRSLEALALLNTLAPECVVIIAYGQIIPARLLSIPQYGWINLHASLLPKYRGAAPINWAIVNGETKTGVTSMRIDAGMDTGEMLLQREIEIDPKETAPELSARLAEAGAPLMVETLRGLAAGILSGGPQDNAKATYAPLLKKEDGRLDWNCPAQDIYNRIRGFAPWPGAFTTFRGKTCHLWGEPVSKERGGDDSGRIDHLSGTLLQQKGELYAACGNATILRLLAVKVEGRKQVTAAEFANGAQLRAGERFGNS
jgi:methionyl-tRNA formyltransferase